LKKPENGQKGAAKAPAGKVRHDERGNAVWQWATDTARNAIGATSNLLRKLDISGLSLEEDADSPPPPPTPSTAVDPPDERLPGKTPPAIKPAASARASPPGGGFNPYNNTGVRVARKPVRSAAAASAANRRRSWWRRLLGKR
jgi:hypothetical protein